MIETTIQNIVVFGNCQGDQLTHLLRALLRGSGIEVLHLSNNRRTGGMLPDEQILAAIQSCDLLVYQPLSKEHGSLSEENILAVLKAGASAISFPYIYNSGITSLCRAPRRSNHGYGFIYGEEIILQLLEEGLDMAAILDRYQKAEINFRLKERFQDSFQEMQLREEKTHIKLTDFIQNNYQQQKLFNTHNHPTNILLLEVIRQLLAKTSLPIEEQDLGKLIFPDLPETNCPISPYDVQVHGYQFPHHQNWFEKGSELISLIIEHHHYESEHPGQILPVQENWLKKALTLLKKLWKRIRTSL